MNSRRLGVGFVGSGFITRFHIGSWQAVRDADVRGCGAPIPSGEEAAKRERVIEWKPDGLDGFVPAVARGEWKP